MSDSLTARHISPAAEAVTAPRRRSDAATDAPAAAGQIIVGHTTDNTARVWVLAPSKNPRVTLELRRIDPKDAGTKCLSEETASAGSDYTVCFDVDELDPSTTYEAEARFTNHERRGPEGGSATATFTTSPRGESPVGRFSFLLGSCNLSIVAINNLAAQAVLLGGLFVAQRSLERPVSHRAPPADRSLKKRLGRRIMRWRFIRRALRWIMQLSLGLLFLGTGGKWPSQPLIKSPFRKLTGLFDGHRIQFCDGHREPRVEDTLVGEKSRATGVLAFAPVNDSGGWREKDGGDEAPAAGFMVLSEVTGQFTDNEYLLKSGSPAGPDARVARVEGQQPFQAHGLSPPAFTIHAGDQIYYDFPNYKRKPLNDSYRDSYREAWFEDRFERSFLSRGAHYMTLDDHEIVNDFSLPEADWPKETEHFGPYVEPALKAYREYVHSRHPGKHTDPKEPLYYEFSYASAEFFVTDTRTRRYRYNKSRMIDEEQMGALQDWLRQHRQALKFVVSSVPFVAELRSVRGRSRDEDKWCGRPFRWQRDEIIDFIENNRVENVVFLVGDMHCCYHASLSIGDRHRWTRRVVHELAGGPLNQLELGRREHFLETAALVTRRGRTPYEVRMHQFHGGAGAVMHVEVTSAADPRAPKVQVPEISWRVVRTMTDPDVIEVQDSAGKTWKELSDHAPIAGRITFGRKDSIDQLQPW